MTATIAYYAFALGAVPAAAQTEDSTVYAEEPTQGLRLPGVFLGGRHDAFSVAANPAGLHFVRGGSFGLVFDGELSGNVTSPGQGWGLFAATNLGSNFLPDIGIGFAAEFLTPPEGHFAPDVGTPTRLSFAGTIPLGNTFAFGAAYRRFSEGDDGRPLSIDGENTWDLGLAFRSGARLAGGMVVRDIGQPTIAQVPTQRRYELELVTRPFSTDRLELGFGGRVGEIRGDVDGWVKWSFRAARGVYLRGEAQTVEQTAIVMGPSGSTAEDSRRDWRLSVGIGISFGASSVTGFGHGAVEEGEDRFGGGTVMLAVNSSHPQSIMPPRRRIERIELKGGIGDRQLTRLVGQLRRIERDSNVAGVILQLDGLRAGWATIQELRRRILAIRKSGKKVLAYIVAGTNGEYYVASAADRIYVDPAGGIRLLGISATSLYFKKLFSSVGVRAQFEKIEEFKSAPEAWTREGPTEPAWRMRNELFSAINDEFIAGIAEGRGISREEVAALINNGPYTAGDLAKLPKLVDQVGEPRDIDTLVATEMGGRFSIGTDAKLEPKRWSYSKVAVIYVEGDIVGGESRNVPLLGRRLVGGDTIVRAIVRARNDSEVKAIILRINSPGGSALASEIMSREVFKTRGSKPIICSMGNYAASGGYFLAAGCDVILAEPMTITGSIGIFTGKFDFSAALSRLGIGTVAYKRGANADLDSMYAPYTDAQRNLVKEKIRYFYGRFIAAVARGRSMKESDVDKIARGRVWTGAQAQKIGLVDQLGGMSEAITLAKERAGFGPEDRVQLLTLPEVSRSLLERVLGGKVPGFSAAQLRAQGVGAVLPWIAPMIGSLPASLLVEPGVPQARLPFAINWN